MTLPDRLLLPLVFDPQLLARDLANLTCDWTPHFVSQNYEGLWNVIPLRCKADAVHPIMMIYSDPTATEFRDTPMLEGSPYFRSVLEQFHCPIRYARLMRLEPGSTIKEHDDLDLSAEEGKARLHIAITTNPDVVFELNRRRVVLEPGRTWYLRLSDPHSVRNQGQTDRVHLVIDVLVNQWMREMMDRAVQGCKSIA